MWPVQRKCRSFLLSSLTSLTFPVWKILFWVLRILTDYRNCFWALIRCPSSVRDTIIASKDSIRIFLNADCEARKGAFGVDPVFTAVTAYAFRDFIFAIILQWIDFDSIFGLYFVFFLFCLIWIDRVCFANRAVNFTGKKSMVYAKVISMEPKDVPEKPTFSRCNISKYFRGCELELIQFFAGDRADRLMRVQFEPVSKPFCFTRDTQKTVLYTGNWCDLMKSECIHLHKLINKFIATSKPVCSCDDIWQVP